MMDIINKIKKMSKNNTSLSKMGFTPTLLRTKTITPKSKVTSNIMNPQSLLKNSSSMYLGMKLNPLLKSQVFSSKVVAQRKKLTPQKSIEQQKKAIIESSGMLQKLKSNVLEKEQKITGYESDVKGYESDVNKLYDDIYKYQIGQLKDYKYYQGNGWLKDFDKALEKKTLGSGEIIGVKKYSKYDEVTGKVTDYEAPAQSTRFDTFLNYGGKTYKDETALRKAHPELKLKGVQKRITNADGSEDWYTYGYVFEGSPMDIRNKEIRSTTDDFNKQMADITLQKDYEPVKWIPEHKTKVQYMWNYRDNRWDKYNKDFSYGGRAGLGIYHSGDNVPLKSKSVDVVVPGAWEEQRILTTYASSAPIEGLTTTIKKGNETYEVPLYSKTYLENGQLITKPYTPTAYGETSVPQLDPAVVLKEAYEITDPEIEKKISEKITGIENIYGNMYKTEQAIEQTKMEEQRKQVQKKAEERRLKEMIPSVRRAKTFVGSSAKTGPTRKVGVSKVSRPVNIRSKLLRPTTLAKKDRPLGKIMRSS